MEPPQNQSRRGSERRHPASRPPVTRSNPGPEYLQDTALRGWIEGGTSRAPSDTLTTVSPKRLIALAGGLALAAVLAVGLVELAGNPTSYTTTQPPPLTPAQMQAQLAGSPQPLALLHAQANQLLGGGAAALHARMQALRGWPVVINKWASWCEPCREEFGVFQRAAANFGRRVAFIGIDSGEESHSQPQAFLSAHPVSYPSYYDPTTQLGVEVSDSTSTPTTTFYNRRGQRSYYRQGAYPSVAKLERDIEHYALGT